MLFTDIIVIFALVVAVVAWWRRSWEQRGNVLVTAAIAALLAGVLGVLDDRWQAGIGTIVAALFLVAFLIGKARKGPPKTTAPFVSGSLFAMLAVLSILMLYWFPMPKLPAPSGQHAVGVTTFELVDENRMGVIVAGPDEPRRLLVRTWYPADNVNGLEPAPYFSDLEATTTATGLGAVMGMPIFFSYTKHAETNSYRGAPLLETAQPLPVVIYSHGYTSFLNQNTALMEELASHGYLVFSIQHTYDSSPTVFPNGDVVPSDPNLAREMMELLTNGGEFPQGLIDSITSEDIGVRRNATVENYRRSVESNHRTATRSGKIWVDDRIFVHDSLEQGVVPDEVADIVAAGDYSRTGQIGMSFGGSTTGAVCMVDSRCSAAVNLDGGDFDFRPFNENLPAPFLMFYSDYQKVAALVSGNPDAKAFGHSDFSYQRHETAGLRDDVYQLKVNDVTHLGVSDFALFMRNPVRGALFGSIDENAIIQIQNDFVRGFFDKHIKGIESDFPDAQFDTHKAWVEPHDLTELRQWWLNEHPEDETTRVVIETELGGVTLALYPERAPIAANNFLAYVDGGHYEGSSFYRAVRPSEGGPFGIVQGGLMTNADFEPLIPPIAHETTDATGIENDIGTISYARLAPGTAGSEFFINLTDNSMLDTGDTSRNPDGQGYTAFGRVLSGWDVLRAIQQQPTDAPVEVEMLQNQIMSSPVLIKRVYRAE